MTDDKTISLSERTSVGLPLKNLLFIGVAVASATYTFYGLKESLNQLDLRLTLNQASVDANSLFIQELQRGTVSTSASQEAFLILEHLAKQVVVLEKSQTEATAARNETSSNAKQNALAVSFLAQRLDTLEAKHERAIESLRDRFADLKNGGPH
jgi:hypothetical protein|tara:strand:- start:290 stop:751 length:462 start_codon:yes stop_codon:yes gene_type:complete